MSVLLSRDVVQCFERNSAFSSLVVVWFCAPVDLVKDAGVSVKLTVIRGKCSECNTFTSLNVVGLSASHF